MKSCLALLVLLSLSARPAAAHISLTSPSPRSADQKQGPCGATGSTRGGNVAVYAPGETITVTWEETVDHVGHYRLAFDDVGNDDFPIPQTPSDDFPAILVDQIEDRSGGGTYSQEITFPDYECEDCTLQLIQVMTTQVPYNSFYFQCADIALRSDGTDSEPGGVDGGCQAGGDGSSSAALALAMLLWWAVRRRRVATDKRRSPPTVA